MRSEKARAARQDADDQVFLDAGIASRIKNERAAGITARCCAFIGGCVAPEQIEIIRVGPRRVIEIELVEILRQIAEGRAKQDNIAIIDRGEGANEILCCMPAPVDPDRGAGRAVPASPVADEIDVVSGAGGLRVGGWRRKCGEEQGPGRDIAGRCIENRKGDVAFKEAKPLGARARFQIVQDLRDVEDGKVRIAARDTLFTQSMKPGRESAPNDQAAPDRVPEIAGIPIIHAMGGEEDGARIDERPRADKAVIAEEHANAGHVGGVVQNAIRRDAVHRHDLSNLLLRQGWRSGQRQDG